MAISSAAQLHLFLSKQIQFSRLPPPPPLFPLNACGRHFSLPSSLSLKPKPSSSPASLKPFLLPRSFRPNTLKPYASRSATITSLFTGIVEEMGRIERLGPSGDADGGFEMRISASNVLGGVQLGDSIAVNGTCLTVSDFDLATSTFTVGLAPETLRRTDLGELAPGCPVNLERAVQPVSRMGGHFVQGHVDGTGEIVSLVPEGDSLWVKVRVAPELMRYIVPKGFIAVDGTSLTVVGVYEEESCFDFMMVAYTQQKVVIALKEVGDKVNLEVDILGKYVEKLLSSRFGNGVSS
ncbi:hypothetical protein Cni_G29256 [Canna indica]|uniref:Riboflavin synthase n=1 Tax=Canna indica TaxID=4628 RepID=A0AAQ3QPF9_9LILI|nr:hypothetical protein Cni_G29256 [Canna indica]